MFSKNIRSMCFAALFCLSGAVSAQEVASTPAKTQAPASMPVSAPEPTASVVLAPEASDALEVPEADRGFKQWLHSTTLYQRLYVRITLHSTPQWRAE